MPFHLGSVFLQINKMTTPLVLVTGISGYIGSWVGYTALQAGYRVRGTVRSVKDENKVKHLRDLCPGSRHKIELVEADLNSDDGWAAAVADCDYILHVASPFPIAEPKDPDELIKPAVEGTLRVLRAASNLPKVPKRVVVTSSVASIAYGHKKDVYTDEDWTNTEENIGAYTKSKALAERAAWKFVEELPAEKKFELATVNPSLVLGPMLSTAGCSSADIVKQILLGEMPALPDLYMGVASVYDVARAHVLAMTLPEAAGKRFMVSSMEVNLRDFGAVLRKEFQPLGYSPTSFHAPNFLVQIMAFFGDAGAKTTAPMLSERCNLNPVNAKAILGLTLQSDHQLILDMAYSAIASGLVPDKSRDHTITKNYVRPEYDCSMIPAAP